MTENRKRRKSSRGARAGRGKLLVLSAVILAILFYAAYLASVVSGQRFGTQHQLVASIICGILFILGTFLAFAAFRKETAFRQLFVVFNVICGLVGVFWVGLRLVQGKMTGWLVLDLVGILIAALVFWVFFFSRLARIFFEEQEFTVKRY